MVYSKEDVEEETVTANLTCVHTEKILSREYYGGIRVHSDDAKWNWQGK